MGTRVVEAIQDTSYLVLLGFSMPTKGILINAKRLEYDNKGGELRLVLERDQRTPGRQSWGQHGQWTYTSGHHSTDPRRSCGKTLKSKKKNNG